MVTKLETDRLILRPIDPDRDFEPWARSMADPETARYLGQGKPLTRPMAWKHMAGVLGHWQIRGYGFFSVEHKQTGEWVGRVGPWYPEGWPEPEVGWTIAREHTRKGYATEAARVCVEYAFRTLRWSRVTHAILVGNAASVAVAEKIGSRQLRRLEGLEGITDDPVLIYGQDAP